MAANAAAERELTAVALLTRWLLLLPLELLLLLLQSRPLRAAARPGVGPLGGRGGLADSQAALAAAASAAATWAATARSPLTAAGAGARRRKWAPGGSATGVRDGDGVSASWLQLLQ